MQRLARRFQLAGSLGDQHFELFSVQCQAVLGFLEFELNRAKLDILGREFVIDSLQRRLAAQRFGAKSALETMAPPVAHGECADEDQRGNRDIRDQIFATSRSR